ncbi:MAG TPA: FecR family protein [bacterium]|jgi:hypothetical protein
MNFIVGIVTLFLVSAEVPAKVSYLVGSAVLERNLKKYSIVLNTQLYTNDVITTGDESVCEIQLSNYSLIRLEPNSSIKIERKEETKKGIFSSIFTSFGEMVSKVTKLNKGDEFEVKTDAAHAFIRGTTFKTMVDKNGSSQFSVFEGKIKVKSLIAGAKEVLLDQNFTTKLQKGQLAPLVEKLPVREIEKFQSQFKDFIDRGKLMDELRGKVDKKIDETKDEIESRVKKSCLFF